jgi:hypothetical protein
MNQYFLGEGRLRIRMVEHPHSGHIQLRTDLLLNDPATVRQLSLEVKTALLHPSLHREVSHRVLDVQATATERDFRWTMRDMLHALVDDFVEQMQPEAIDQLIKDTQWFRDRHPSSDHERPIPKHRE